MVVWMLRLLNMYGLILMPLRKELTAYRESAVTMDQSPYAENRKRIS
jgi:hypothetical protein